MRSRHPPPGGALPAASTGSRGGEEAGANLPVTLQQRLALPLFTSRRTLFRELGKLAAGWKKRKIQITYNPICQFGFFPTGFSLPDPSA